MPLIKRNPSRRGPGDDATRAPAGEVEEQHPAGILPGDTIESADTIRMPGPIHKVYRFFISKRTGIGLILAMCFMTLMGTVLPQSTESVRADPQDYADFLDGVRPKFRGWTGVLDWLGLFNAFGAWWFKAVNILLCISILCCVIHRIPLLWKRATRPQLHVTEGFFAHSSIHHDLTTTLPAEQAQNAARALLARRGYRVLDDPRGPGLNTYADRHRWMPFGTIAAHIAFVIILLGCLITANTGFSISSLPVTIGSKVPVGNGTDLEVEATSFQDTYYDDRRPKDYVSHLVVYKDGAKVKEQDTRVNQPLRVDGVKFFQSAFGFAAMIEVKDSAGAVVYSGGVPMKYSDEAGKTSVGKLPLTSQGLDVLIITAASGATDSGLAPGEASIRVYKTGTNDVVDQKVVTQGSPTAVGDLTYTFQREQQYTDLKVSDDPGALWVWIGSVMIVVGMTITMFLRHRRIWVRVRPVEGGSRIRIASSERHDTAFEDWVAELVEDLSVETGATPTTNAASDRDRHSTVGV